MNDVSSIETKLKILSDSAKYDVSCSSSASNRKNFNNGIGNAHISGICHSWSSDGRCVSLLKILMTNFCIYDCQYCVNRKSNDIARATLSPDEIVNLTINFYRRNYIEGLFLSSGILKNPDYTMERLILVAKKLRLIEKFNGYIHIKVIPGASKELIYELGLYVDRVSVNVELPDNKGLQLLAPDKKLSSIISSMSHIKNKLLQREDERKIFKSTPSFVPAGQTTQMIIGASGESDYTIINKSESLYNANALKRVYYSAYIPVNQTGALAKVEKTPLLREHRLYQADFLLRFYNFKANELLDYKHPFFDPLLDPKANWAINNFDVFPIEINTASYDELLRVPGIGVKSALRIIKARKYGKIQYEHLKKIGVVLKRAKFFITTDGKFYGYKTDYSENVRTKLLEMDNNIDQISFAELGYTFSNDKNPYKQIPSIGENYV